MTQLTAKPVDARPAASVALGLAGIFVVVAALLGAAVLRAPIAISVFGLAILGLAHICFEVRYVIGRFGDRLGGAVGWVLVLVLSLMALARVVAALNRTLGHQLEAIGAFGLLGAAAWLGLRGRRRPAAFIIAVIATVGLASLIWPQWYWHVITHLHNFIPLAFLWDWSRRLNDQRARITFISAQALWAVLIPGLIIGGTLDRFINPEPGAAAYWIGDGSALLSAAAPPGASPELALRYLVAFAFLQSMHYVVWIGFFPLAARDTTAAFGRAIPVLRGWRFGALAMVLSAGVLVAFAASYGLGRQIYSLLATYHVYLEFPLLIFMVVGWGSLIRKP